MNKSRLRLGPVSYLAFLLWSLLLVALLPDASLWLLLVATAVFDQLTTRSGWRILTRRRFWLFILSILALSPLLLGETDLHWSGLRFSRTGLAMGAWMALRATTLMLAFNVALGNLGLTQMIRLFEALRLRGLGLALGVALNMGPVLRDVVSAAYHTLRLRGGLRRPVHNARLFLITIMANTLRYGDDIVKAAAARAFDPLHGPAQNDSVLNRNDKIFVAGLIAAGAGLLLAI